MIIYLDGGALWHVEIWAMEIVHTFASGVEHKLLFHMQLFIFEGKDSLGYSRDADHYSSNTIPGVPIYHATHGS
jgi:hypothetical protein